MTGPDDVSLIPTGDFSLWNTQNLNIKCTGLEAPTVTIVPDYGIVNVISSITRERSDLCHNETELTIGWGTQDRNERKRANGATVRCHVGQATNTTILNVKCLYQTDSCHVYKYNQTIYQKHGVCNMF